MATDLYELEFLSVETDKSGDAIVMRYVVNDIEYVQVVDGGFQSTGDRVVAHLQKYYAADVVVDHVVATHPDGDHAGGLRTVLETVRVNNLWMLRPWLYAAELISQFPTYSSIDRLRSRLRSLYPNLVALEEIAERKNIPIREPFQGALIGAFHVLAPSKARYFDLIVRSDKTPETVPDGERTESDLIKEILEKAVAKLTNLVRAAWGVEVFSTEATSCENEMSVVQYAKIADHKIVLTGDAGRGALTEAALYAPLAGLFLPGVDRFQVPHHGSRRNVSSELLDVWLGSKKEKQQDGSFIAIVSSAKADTAHPRRSVVRAMIHRGATVYATEGQDMRFIKNAPPRPTWTALTPLDYPSDQEE